MPLPEIQKALNDPHYLARLTSLTRNLINPLWLPSHEEIDQVFQPTIEGPLGTMEVFEKRKTFFNNYVRKELGMYLVVTRELIEGLVAHLAKHDAPKTILEVGAGNGRLSHYLKEALDEKAVEPIHVVATDSYAWRIKTDFPVENIESHAAALHYNPDLIISSWMLSGPDLTRDWRRNAPNLKEYILIGVPEWHITGNSVETWGVHPDGPPTEDLPPYEQEGFQKHKISLPIIQHGSEYTTQAFSFRRAQ